MVCGRGFTLVRWVVRGVRHRQWGELLGLPPGKAMCGLLWHIPLFRDLFVSLRLIVTYVTEIFYFESTSANHEARKNYGLTV
jgi:hypothetical protein